MGGPEVAGGSAVQEQLHSAGHVGGAGGGGAEVTGGCTGAPAAGHVSAVSRVSCPTVAVRLAGHANIPLPALVKIHGVRDRLAEVLQLQSSPPGTY